MERLKKRSMVAGLRATAAWGRERSRRRIVVV